MGGQLVVHSEFGAESCTVLKNHHNDPDVLSAPRHSPTKIVSGSNQSQTHRRRLAAGAWALGCGWCPNTRVSWWLRKIRKRTAGTIMATRQAVFAGMPELTFGLNSAEIINICVTPPPKFPQPAAVALAVPTTFGGNIKEHQVGDKGSSCRVCPSKILFCAEKTCIHTTNVTDVFWG